MVRARDLRPVKPSKSCPDEVLQPKPGSPDGINESTAPDLH